MYIKTMSLKKTFEAQIRDQQNIMYIKKMSLKKHQRLKYDPNKIKLKSQTSAHTQTTQTTNKTNIERLGSSSFKDRGGFP